MRSPLPGVGDRKGLGLGQVQRGASLSPGVDANGYVEAGAITLKADGAERGGAGGSRGFHGKAERKPWSGLATVGEKVGFQPFGWHLAGGDWDMVSRLGIWAQLGLAQLGALKKDAFGRSCSHGSSEFIESSPGPFGTCWVAFGVRGECSPPPLPGHMPLARELQLHSRSSLAMAALAVAVFV